MNSVPVIYIPLNVNTITIDASMRFNKSVFLPHQGHLTIAFKRSIMSVKLSQFNYFLIAAFFRFYQLLIIRIPARGYSHCAIVVLFSIREMGNY